MGYSGVTRHAKVEACKFSLPAVNVQVVGKELRWLARWLAGTHGWSAEILLENCRYLWCGFTESSLV